MESAHVSLAMLHLGLKVQIVNFKIIGAASQRINLVFVFSRYGLLAAIYLLTLIPSAITIWGSFFIFDSPEKKQSFLMECLVILIWSYPLFVLLACYKIYEAYSYHQSVRPLTYVAVIPYLLFFTVGMVSGLLPEMFSDSIWPLLFNRSFTVTTEGDVDEFPDENVRELIREASRNNLMKVDQAILKGANINFEGTKGRTPLMLVAEDLNVSAVKLLLEKGARADKVILEKTSAAVEEDWQISALSAIWNGKAVNGGNHHRRTLEEERNSIRAAQRSISAQLVNAGASWKVKYRSHLLPYHYLWSLDHMGLDDTREALEWAIHCGDFVAAAALLNSWEWFRISDSFRTKLKLLAWFADAAHLPSPLIASSEDPKPLTFFVSKNNDDWIKAAYQEALSKKKDPALVEKTFSRLFAEQLYKN